MIVVSGPQNVFARATSNLPDINYTVDFHICPVPRSNDLSSPWANTFANRYQA